VGIYVGVFIMKMLITGGCGFIGSNFVRYILKKHPSYKVINLDKLTYCGCRENLIDIHKDKRYRFVKGDICDRKLVNGLTKACDAIVNFAAESVSKNTYLPIWCIGEIKIMTLEELFDKLSKDKRNKIIEINGIEVINLKFTNYKAISYKGGIGYWMPIKQISRHRYAGKIIKLSQKWGEIEVTPNHSIYDCDFNLASPVKNPELLPLRNINHIPKKKKYLNYSGEKLHALIRIFAAYITEGWTTHNKRNGSYQIGVANKDKKWITKLKEDLELLGFAPNITRTKDNLFQLMVSNKSLFTFLRKEAGFGSRNKFIPSFIFQLRRKFQDGFLKTMIFGDGEVIKNKNYETQRFTTTSKKMASGFGLLLTLLKYVYTVSVDERSNAYTFRSNGDYTISLLKKKCKKTNYNDYVYDISVDTLKNFVCGVGNIVVHNTHVDRSIDDASDFIRTNVDGVRVILEAARKNKIKRFIQISTDETYGSIRKGSFKETTLLHPNSPYAASKAAGDHLALAYHTTFKLPVIVTRSSNNFGPYQFPEKVIPLFITNLLENKKVPLYGDGLNVRDWLYVMDNCRAIDMILHKGKPGEIYNIGGEYEIPNIKLTRIILKLLNKTYRMIEYVPDRLGHDRRYSLDSKKMKKLGWKPEKDFNTAIRETIKWYENNRSWWKELK